MLSGAKHLLPLPSVEDDAEGVPHTSVAGDVALAASGAAEVEEVAVHAPAVHAAAELGVRERADGVVPCSARLPYASAYGFNRCQLFVYFLS